MGSASRDRHNRALAGAKRGQGRDVQGRTVLVSFADGAFARRGPVFRAQAEATGFFDTVAVHDLQTLPAGFRACHGAYLRRTPRGFGYWIWKPVVILEALERAGPQDVVVYLDAGFTLNPGGGRRFAEYLEITRDSAAGMLSFQNVFTEAHWTKVDLAHRLGLGAGHLHMKTSQLGSGFVMLRPTPGNRDLVRTWAAVAVEDGYRFSDDSPSRRPEHPEFREHRHDQSIASLLRKSHGTAVTHYEVQAYDGRFEALRPGLPAWATRARA